MMIDGQSLHNVWDEYVVAPLTEAVNTVPWQEIAESLPPLRDHFVSAGQALWGALEKTRVNNPRPLSDTEGRITHLAIATGAPEVWGVTLAHINLLVAREHAGYPFDHVTILVPEGLTQQVLTVLLGTHGVDLSRITFLQYPPDATPDKMRIWIRDPILVYTQDDRTILRGVPSSLDITKRNQTSLPSTHLAHLLCAAYDTITCEGPDIDTPGGNLLVTAGTVFIGTGTTEDMLASARLRWEHGTRYHIATLGTPEEKPADGHLDMYMHPTGMHTNEGKPIVVIADPTMVDYEGFKKPLERDIAFLQRAGFQLYFAPVALTEEQSSEGLVAWDTYTNVLFEHYFVQGEERCVVTLPQYDRLPLDVLARFTYAQLGCIVIPVDGLQHVSPRLGSLRCITKVLARGPVNE